MVTSFTQALWAETEGTGVRVLAFCPGPVDNTRFRQHAGGRSPFADRRSQPREVAVAAALRAFERGDPLVVPGLVNSLLATVVGFAPRRPQLLMTARVFKRSADNEARSRASGQNGHPPSTDRGEAS